MGIFRHTKINSTPPAKTLCKINTHKKIKLMSKNQFQNIPVINRILLKN